MAGDCGKDVRGHDSHFHQRQSFHGRDRIVGSDFIAKTLFKGRQEILDLSDPFGVHSPVVSYSLNKAKRWQMVQRPEDALNDKKSVGRVSMIVALVPRSANIMPVLKELEKVRGGVVEYAEAEDGQVTVHRKGKGNRATLDSLQNQPGPGPYSRRERRMQKEEKKREEKLRKMMGNENEEEEENEEEQVQYIVVKMRQERGELNENAWRKQQTRTRVQPFRHRTLNEDQFKDIVPVHYIARKNRSAKDMLEDLEDY